MAICWIGSPTPRFLVRSQPARSWRRRCSALLLILSAAPWGAFAFRAQEGHVEAPKIRVILGEDVMVPGYKVTIPVVLEIADGSRVGPLEIEVSVPSAKVSFDGIRPGFVADQVGAEITYAVEERGPLSVVNIRMVPKESAAVPPGFLFDLVFNIGKAMSTADPPVVLGNKASAYDADRPSQALAGVGSKDGLIRVIAEPTGIASCFFYMH